MTHRRREPTSSLQSHPSTRGSDSSLTKRVLVVEANADGTVGGSHQIMFDTLTRVDRSRFEPVPCFYQDNLFANRFRELGFEVILLEDMRSREVAIRERAGRVRKNLDVLGAIARRRRILVERRVDLLHLNNSPHVGFSDWLPAGRLSRTPVVVNAMGDAEPIGGWRLNRSAVASFDHYLPISRYMEAALRTQGIQDRRMTLVRAGVDVLGLRDAVEKTRDQIRSELAVSDEQRLVMMVGNVREWKGQHVVVEALGLLPPELRDRVVVGFVGAERGQEDDYGARLRDMSRELEVDSALRWLGSRNDVATLFAAADVGLHASVVPEPFGLVMVECMAVGTPVVAAKEGGAAEIVSPETGWVYPGGDAETLAALLAMVARFGSADPILAERRAACLKRSEEFDVQGMVEGVEAVWEHVLRRAPNG